MAGHEEDEGRWYTHLDAAYDKEHRGRAIENGRVLDHIWMRGHGQVLRWDPRFEPYFRRVGLLAFVLQFKRTPPKYNHAALSALIDRWRSETHSFHLPCGEMTVTLEDFAMITGFPIDVCPLIGRTKKANWRNRVIALIGDCSPEPAGKDNRSFGVPFKWLFENRSGVPNGADAQTVVHYARAYLWYLLC